MKRANVIEHFGLAKKRKLDNQFINYVNDVPSLKSIALVAVAVQLLDVETVSDLNIGPARELALKSLENFKIKLPLSIKREIKSTIFPIKSQMSWLEDVGQRYKKEWDWKSLYEERRFSYWTVDGIFDKVKFLGDIFEEIKTTRLRNLSFVEQYKTACTFCIEDCITTFWSKLPKSKRKTKLYIGTSYKNHLAAYWTATMNNELPNFLEELLLCDAYNLYDRDLSICANIMSSLIAIGNIEAMKYFWNYKLTEDEKHSNIRRWIDITLKRMKITYFDSYEEGFNLNIGKEKIHLYDDDVKRFGDDRFCYHEYDKYTHIMCFLLSQLNSSGEQKEIFQSHSKVILLSLFPNWPFVKYFLPTISVMMDFLPENIYIGIMIKIFRTTIDYRTKELFRGMWDIAPMNLRKAFICFLQSNAIIIVRLFFKGDDDIIDKILSIASLDERKQIFFRMLNESDFRVHLQSTNSSKECISSAMDRLASKIAGDDLHLFKQEVMSRYAKKLSSQWILAKDIKSVSILLNWAAQCLEENCMFKKTYIDVNNLYIKWVCKKKNKFVGEFLNWYFGTKEEISQFKKSFVNKDNLENCKSLLKSLGKRGEVGWEHFKRFLSFASNSGERLVQLKRVLKNAEEQDNFLTGCNEKFKTLFKEWHSASVEAEEQ